MEAMRRQRQTRKHEEVRVSVRSRYARAELSVRCASRNACSTAAASEWTAVSISESVRSTFTARRMLYVRIGTGYLISVWLVCVQFGYSTRTSTCTRSQKQASTYFNLHWTTKLYTVSQSGQSERHDQVVPRLGQNALFVVQVSSHRYRQTAVQCLHISRTSCSLLIQWLINKTLLVLLLNI